MKKVIYGIKDLRNDQIVYIGQTKQFEERKRHHFNDNTQHIDKHIKSNGTENFDMFIIEVIEDPNIVILERENYYIELFGTIKFGFNKHKSGGNQSNFKKDERRLLKEERKKMNATIEIKREKARAYYQKHKNDEDLKKRRNEAQDKWIKKQDPELLKKAANERSKLYYQKHKEERKAYARAHRRINKG